MPLSLEFFIYVTRHQCDLICLLSLGPLSVTCR